MKIDYKRIHIGKRTIKSAIAVILALMAVSRLGTTSASSRMVFAMLGAMSAMENTFKQSWEACKAQIIGMMLGALVAAGLSFVPIHSMVTVGIGVIIVIVIYNMLGIYFSPNLPCLVVVMSCMNTDVFPFEYALGRLWDTAIGLAIGMVINILILPYDNSLKIKQTIEYLEEEVIEFLEDMFDGDKEYPDTEKMRKTIDTMASQLGIYSSQWIPFSVKQDKEKLQVFLQCENKARELMAQMEVLSQMENPGRLDEDMRVRLTDAGAVIRDKRAIAKINEADIITNYHVGKILDLREDLMLLVEKMRK